MLQYIAFVFVRCSYWITNVAKIEHTLNTIIQYTQNCFKGNQSRNQFEKHFAIYFGMSQ